jgi:basic membrane lipoprotein Med (substrate-binding protein (PBP1-ABC) superfamily)
MTGDETAESTESSGITGIDRRTVLASSASLLGTSLIAGCGDDGDGTSSTDPDSTQIGFVGGEQGSLIQAFEESYVAGAEYIEEDVDVNVGYSGDFSDTQAAKNVADSQYDDGADIIYHAASKAGEGVFKSAQEADRFAIGVDADQSGSLPDYSDVILGSAVKYINEGTQEVAEAVAQDDFTSVQGPTTLGIADGAVDFIIGQDYGGSGAPSEDVDPATEGEATEIAIVSSPAGFDDNAFNDLAVQGLEAAQGDYNININEVEETSQGNYESTQQNLAESTDPNYDLIVLVGFNHKTPLETNAEEYGDQNWMLINDYYDSSNDNVAGYTWANHEMSYLAGVAAATMTTREFTSDDDELPDVVNTNLDDAKTDIEEGNVEVPCTASGCQD